VLDVQGDVKEHEAALKRAAHTLGLKAQVVTVKNPKDIKALHAIIIPGGESTTIGMLMKKYGMLEALREVSSEIPVFGTCAGMVMLAKEGGNMKDGQPLLNLMDARVIRNAYGRQRDSFEADLNIPVLGREMFHGVFIRAPALERIWGRCKSLCVYDGRVVFARQDNLLAVAFHPELTDDTRVHEYFLEMI